MEEWAEIPKYLSLGVAFLWRIPYNEAMKNDDAAAFTACTCSARGGDGAPMGCWHDDADHEAPAFTGAADRPMPVGVVDDEPF